MNTFELALRHYRLYPKSKREEDFDESQFGHETRKMEFTTDNSAIVSIDTWNCAYAQDPFYPEWGKYYEYTYMGSGKRFIRRARDILDNHISPLFDAARQAGLLIIHSNTDYIILQNHPDKYAKLIPPKSSKRWVDNYADDWPPKQVKEEISKDYVCRTWGEDAYEKWPAIRRKMDFAPSAAPKPGDLVIPQNPEGRMTIQDVLKQRKIINLFYVGFMLNGCLLFKPGGIREMGIAGRGYRIIVLRDCVAGNESAETIGEFKMTEMFLVWQEIYASLTADSKELIEGLAE